MADERLAIDRLISELQDSYRADVTQDIAQRVAEECARIARSMKHTEHPIRFCSFCADVEHCASVIEEQFRLGGKP